MNSAMFRSLAIAAAATALLPFAASAAEIDLGAALPAVHGVDQDNQPVDLQAAGGQGFTLVYFYPKADTPGCTKQACSLRDGYAKLQDKGVRIFGVSGDDVASQKAFEAKYHLPFRLIADHDQKVMDAFGVPHHMSFATRQAFLFKDGKLVWRDLHAATEQQAADVLAAIAKL